jgi:hypothetical protein
LVKYELIFHPLINQKHLTLTQKLNMKHLLPKLSCLFFLFFCYQIKFTEAQIIYTDIIPDSVFSAANGTLSVDLNNDSIIDFYLTTSSKTITSTGCGGSKVNKYLSVTPANSNNSVFNTLNLPAALALNSSIDSNSQFWKNTASQKMAADTFLCTSSGPGFPGGGRPRWVNSGSGNFRNIANKCLAVRFYVDTQLYYGWIRFSITTNLTVTLKDYAYQSNGTPSILAGQTNDNYIATSASNVNKLCAGDSIYVGYTIFGNFDTANVVSVEFSDSLGNFNNGTSIGSKKSNISGTVPSIIPPSFSGTGFRFRVISSNPAQIAIDNGTNLIINNKLPDTLVTPSKNQFICSGSSVALAAQLGNGNSYQWKKDNVNLSGSTSTNRIYSANTSGLFSCDISNGCGTVNSNVVSLTVISLPAISIIPSGPITINLGDSAILSSNSVDTSLIYRWYRNSVLLNPTVSSMTYTAKVSGTYTLRIIEQLSGCFKISSGVVVNVQNTSAVPEINSAQSNLRVQPNPFSNSVSILLSNREGQNFSVKIFDLAGRLVKTIASDVSEGGNFEYNWTADDQNGNPINSGIYFLQLEANNSSQTKKLILVR